MDNKVLNEEIELIQSMYGSDFIITRITSPFSFKLALYPNTGMQKDSQFVIFHIVFTFEEQYPIIEPKIEFEHIRGISQENIIQLKIRLENKSRELVGAPMIFELIEMAKDFLTESNGSPDSDCAICLSEIGDVAFEEFVRTPCFHHFHSSCFLEYKKSIPKDSALLCPVCREILPPRSVVIGGSKGTAVDPEEVAVKESTEKETISQTNIPEQKPTKATTPYLLVCTISQEEGLRMDWTQAFITAFKPYGASQLKQHKGIPHQSLVKFGSLEQCFTAFINSDEQSINGTKVSCLLCDKATVDTFETAKVLVEFQSYSDPDNEDEEDSQPTDDYEYDEATGTWESKYELKQPVVSLDEYREKAWVANKDQYLAKRFNQPSKNVHKNSDYNTQTNHHTTYKTNSYRKQNQKNNTHTENRNQENNRNRNIRNNTQNQNRNQYKNGNQNQNQYKNGNQNNNYKRNNNQSQNPNQNGGNIYSNQNQNQNKNQNQNNEKIKYNNNNTQNNPKISYWNLPPEQKTNIGRFPQ